MPHLAIKGRVAKKKQIEQYVVNLCHALNINRFYSKIIFLNFKSDLGDRYGDCWGDRKDGYAEINIARKISGDNVSFNDMMKTLAHEMVHVKQYFRNELNGYATTWKGRNAGGYKYENQPWEREAHRLEAKLFNECWPD